MHEAARRTFWRRTRRLTLALLAAWLLVDFTVPWFARDLDRWRGFGFPAGYWLAAQGALLLFLLIIVVYVVVMDRLEADYRSEIESGEAASGGARSGPP